MLAMARREMGSWWHQESSVEFEKTVSPQEESGPQPRRVSRRRRRQKTGRL